MTGSRYPARVRAPEFPSGTWLNTAAPLSLKELRGKVVLLDFWTFCCGNCLHVLDELRSLEHDFAEELVIIGVHSPEFPFEHNVDLVRHAVEDRAIDYPVAVDNDYAVWTSFANHYWPALYFVDTDGIIRDQHFGEGRYEQSERLIQRLLGIDRDSATVEGLGIEVLGFQDVQVEVFHCRIQCSCNKLLRRPFFLEGVFATYVISRVEGAALYSLPQGLESSVGHPAI